MHCSSVCDHKKSCPPPLVLKMTGNLLTNNPSVQHPLPFLSSCCACSYHKKAYTQLLPMYITARRRSKLIWNYEKRVISFSTVIHQQTSSYYKCYHLASLWSWWALSQYWVMAICSHKYLCHTSENLRLCNHTRRKQRHMYCCATGPHNKAAC